MGQLRIAIVYTLWLGALAVGAGIVFGILSRVAGIEHQWGAFDLVAVIQLVAIVAITFGVFATLANRHANRYYTTGSIVVVLNTIISVASAYVITSQSAREDYSWRIAVIAPLVLSAVALAFGGLIGRMRQSSSNTSLERTRER